MVFSMPMPAAAGVALLHPLGGVTHPRATKEKKVKKKDVVVVLLLVKNVISSLGTVSKMPVQPTKRTVNMRRLKKM